MNINTFRVQANPKPACTRVDPDLFYSEGEAETALAKRICATCPLRLDCLEGAMDRGESFGVWGGKDPYERGALTKKRNQLGPRANGAVDRRRRVVELSARMKPAEIAEVLGVPVHIVHADRIRAGIAVKKIGNPAKVIRLRAAGLTITGIATQTGLGESTVKRYLTRSRAGAAA